MKVAVFGLGYVGSVTAALLAQQGHDVIGIDVDESKVDMIRRGIPPVLEPGLDEILTSVVENGSLVAESQLERANDWDVALVCVGTPSSPAGDIDFAAMNGVLAQIGEQLHRADTYRVVAIRSTVLPEAIHEIIVPRLTESVGAAPGEAYGLATVPEFLREGSSVQDFMQPPFTLIGQYDQRSGDVIEQLLQFVPAPFVRAGMAEAMMVKYASNCYHALKVAFANEIQLLCAADGLDSHQVMDIFCMDEKLNVSRRYLRPGFAFGGSCLPKDLRALNYRARQTNQPTPVLRATLESNRSYLDRCVEMVLGTDRQRIGVVGLAFKSGTDDLRESPMIGMVEALIGKGKEIAIYDADVRLSQLKGKNLEYIQRHIPHVAGLLCDKIEDVIAHAEVLVLAHADQVIRSRIEAEFGGQQLILDFDEPLSREWLRYSNNVKVV
ncbi:MAG: nucleotide sugar dehydrogenase [Gammaproteobacteria bacterium]|nr:nucleotide sugar dehydrogenase [Gammaproteobacteria bacterium]